MTKTIAFYDPYVSGHHIEYLYHILNYKVANNINANFILFVQKDFDNQINELLELEQLKNNQIEIIHIENMVNDENFKFEQSLENYKKQLFALNDQIINKKIEHCVFMYLDNAMQIALSTSLGKNLGCKLSGIILNPFGGFGKGIFKYYYSIRRILQNYIMMSNKKISSIYIIIDEKTTKLLNHIHLTSKYKYVSDPIIDLKGLGFQQVLESKPEKRKVFLLFGSLNRRKGLFKILYVLRKLEDIYLGKIKIIFAGSISEKDKKLFITEYNMIQSKSPNSVEIIDEYLSFQKVYEYFNKADYILLPYDTTQASSGVLGYAAYFKKPIIGQGGGNFGKHVSDYKLGLAINNLNEDKLLEVFVKILDENIKIDYDINGMERYAKSRRGEHFASTIIENVLK